MKNRADIFSGIHAIPIMMLKESTVVKSPNFPVLSSILSYSLSWLPTTIKTPKNTTIYSAQYFTGIDYNSTEQAAIKAEIESVYSPAQVVEPATWTYNCHSYAWHLSQGETSVVWLNAYDETHTDIICSHIGQTGVLLHHLGQIARRFYIQVIIPH